jgi:ATP-binding cassette subfamily B protein
MSFGFYDDRQTGELMNRMTNDTFWLGELCHHGPEDIVITSIKFFGTFIVLLTIDVQLTLIVFAFFPPMAAYAFYFNRQMNVALRASKDRIGDINAQAEDSLAGVRVVKSFTNAAIERAKFAIENDRFVEAKGEGYRSESYLYNGVVAFTQVFTIVIVVFGGASIAGGSLDLVDLVTFVLYIGLLVEPIRTALNFARLYQEGTTGFDRLVEVLEIEPDIEDSKQALELQHVRGNVAFRNITFGYKDDDTHVFRDLSLEIEAGEFVALVGSSGVGKTTLCSLIPRFYEVSNGSIAIDGHDVRDIRQSSLRRNIGIVQQDTYLFAGTIADNIRYGRPDATHNEVIEASRRAHAHDFIMALQDGYATDVGQRGVKLSGGQRQRLSIARVF